MGLLGSDGEDAARVKQLLVGNDGHLQYKAAVDFMDQYRGTLDRQAEIIADSIAMVACEQHSLFKRTPRPVSLAETISCVKRRLAGDPEMLRLTEAEEAGQATQRLTTIFLSDVDVELDE
jgi:hypothetical protein